MNKREEEQDTGKTDEGIKVKEEVQEKVEEVVVEVKEEAPEISQEEAMLDDEMEEEGDDDEEPDIQIDEEHYSINHVEVNIAEKSTEPLNESDYCPIIDDSICIVDQNEEEEEEEEMHEDEEEEDEEEDHPSEETEQQPMEVVGEVGKAPIYLKCQVGSFFTFLPVHVFHTCSYIPSTIQSFHKSGLLCCPPFHTRLHEPHAPPAQGERAGAEQAVQLRHLRPRILLPLQPELSPEQGTPADNGADLQVPALSLRHEQQERDATPPEEQPQENRLAERGVELQVQDMRGAFLEHCRTYEAHRGEPSGCFGNFGEMLPLPPYLAK